AGEHEQDLLDRPPAPQHGRGLAEGRHHPVRLAQREDGAQLRGLLTLDGGEGADASLALQPQHALVQPPAEQHGAVETAQIVGGKLGLQRGVEDAVAVQDGQVLDGELRLEDGSRHRDSSPTILPSPNCLGGFSSAGAGRTHRSRPRLPPARGKPCARGALLARALARTAESGYPRAMRVRVRIPASSANLGPGFDALALALALYNEVELEESD